MGARVGFVCNWEPVPARTWSHIPSSLRAALAEECDLVDLGVTLPRWQREGLRLLYARRRGGRWTSRWKWSPALTAIVRRQVEARVREDPVDAIVQIHGLARLDEPYYVFQDLSLDVVIDEVDRGRARYLGFDNMGIDRAAMVRRRRHQREVYDGAAGLLAMSRWFAAHLVAHTGVAADRVHVVHPGTNAAVGRGATLDRASKARHRLLFVGRDFHRKGGAEVVAALAHIRARLDRTVTLTVCGPARWPLPGPVPDGVDFKGEVAPGRLTDLYAEHDLFVMPSHFEAFGIAFAEALTNGLPCVARNAYGMREIIAEGEDGLLVDDDSPEVLAATIMKALGDDSVYATVTERAAARAAYYSWGRAARQIHDIVAGR